MSITRAMLFVVVALLVLDVNAPAWAYLDPGTGSMILQAVLGGIAGALVVGRLYWHKLKNFFRGRSQDPNADN